MIKRKLTTSSGWLAFLLLLALVAGQHLVSANSPTGHEVSAQFQAAYQQNGGLSVLGYAISEPYMGMTEDKDVRTVQVFERGALELHDNQVMMTRGYALHPEIWPPGAFCSIDQLDKLPYVTNVNVVDRANGHAMVTVKGPFQVPPGWEVDWMELQKQHYPANIPATSGDQASFWAPQCNQPSFVPMPTTKPAPPAPTGDVCSLSSLKALPYIESVTVLNEQNGQAKVVFKGSGSFQVPLCKGKSWEVDYNSQPPKHYPEMVNLADERNSTWWAPENVKPLK